MGGTGLEPVTPSLSRPQDWCSPFAKLGALLRVCSGFLGFNAVAFARVSARFRTLLLAPVSTVEAAPTLQERLNAHACARTSAAHADEVASAATNLRPFRPATRHFRLREPGPSREPLEEH